MRGESATNIWRVSLACFTEMAAEQQAYQRHMAAQQANNTINDSGADFSWAPTQNFENDPNDEETAILDQALHLQMHRSQLAQDLTTLNSTMAEKFEQLKQAELRESELARAHDEIKEFQEKLLSSHLIDRLNLGPISTMKISWDQPHEGNMFEFLYKRRSIGILAA